MGKYTEQQVAELKSLQAKAEAITETAENEIAAGKELKRSIVSKYCEGTELAVFDPDNSRIIPLSEADYAAIAIAQLLSGATPAQTERAVIRKAGTGEIGMQPVTISAEDNQAYRNVLEELRALSTEFDNALEAYWQRAAEFYRENEGDETSVEEILQGGLTIDPDTWAYQRDNAEQPCC